MTTAKELLSKYIENTERVFAEMDLSPDRVYVDKEKIKDIIDAANRYLEDAKYYRDRKQFETGLVSVAYAEGLLDALRLLRLAEFKWPAKTNM
jgi:FAD synthetase